ncbi:MAG: hypothetical protein ACRCTA_02335, partial [Bacilli bacterium]
MKKQLLRSEVPLSKTWDLSLIYLNDEAFYEAYSLLETRLKDASLYQDHLGEGVSLFKEALLWQEKLHLEGGKLYAYAHMKEDQDTSNDRYQTMASKALNLISEIGVVTSFFKNNFLELGQALINEYLKSDQALSHYQFYFDTFFKNAQYILSSKEELILSKASETLNASAKTYEVLSNADLKFKDITFGNEKYPLSNGLYGK